MAPKLALAPALALYLLAFATLAQSEDTEDYVKFTAFNRLPASYYEGLARVAISDVIVCEGNAAKFKTFLGDIDDLAKEELEWILPMFDAWGKFPSGLFTGNLVDYGQFDECISIGSEERPNARGIKGQYCGFAVKAPVLGAPISWAVCIPDECTLGQLDFTEGGTNLTISGAMCQTKGSYNKLENEDIAAIAVFGTILGIILLSSVYDGVLHYTDKKTIHPLCIAFSAVTNSKKLFAVSNAPGQVACLHGIRAISLMWIIAGHRFVSAGALPSVNLLQAIEFRGDIASSYISSARAAVDTFFLFSAFLVSYIYFKGVRAAIAKAEAKGSSNVQNPLTWVKIPMYYIHRILRITPALAAVFFVSITFYRRIGEGPLWPFLNDMMTTTCHKWWWSLFLYVQNYVNYEDMCIVPTWYLSADMQLYLLSPFLIIPLGQLYIKGKRKLAYIVVCIVIIISIVVPMTIDFFREFDVLNIYETHHRTSVYSIGILFGMIVVDCTGKKIRINHFLNLLLWGLSLGVMLTIVLTMHDTESFPGAVKNNLFFTFTRPVWSAAVCYIVFACHFGYGGPVNWFLSKSVFQVMTKLSFSMYLLHNLMITLSIGTSKVPGHFSEYETIYSWCGDYITTIVCSVVWVLCFESPIVVLEKVIFGTGKRPEKPTPTPSAPVEPVPERLTIEDSPETAAK